MKKILCPGEALIDFVAVEADCTDFIKKAGGAPANAAGAMRKFGVQSYFAGSVGQDPFGQFLSQEMTKYGINIEYLQELSNELTSFVYVSIDESGERDFVFNRGADQNFTIELPKIGEFAGIHFASATAFLGGELEKTYYNLLEWAKENNLLISFDANYREALFGDKQERFINACQEFIAKSNIVKLSEEEACLISGINDLNQAAWEISKLGCDYLIITLGAKGSLLTYKSKQLVIDSIKLEQVVDTTGAGDAFIGALVAQAINDQNLSFETMKEYIEVANKIGALTTTKYGALASIPSLEAVQDLN